MAKEPVYTENALGAVGSYVQAVGKIYPARFCFQVAKLPLGGVVEIECTAEL